MTKFVDAYNKDTGDKLPHQVPENFFDIFPNLAKTPKAKAAQKAAETTGAKNQTDSKKEGN